MNYINNSSATTTGLISVQSGAQYWGNGGPGLVNTGNAADQAIGMAANAVVHLRGMQNIQGGATFGAFFCSNATDQIWDDGGNTLTGSATGNGCTAANFYGSPSITGVALAASNLTPTSGFGTGCATAGQCMSAVSGNSQRAQFTVTYGTTPSSPQVLTVTFPTPFWATPLCSLIDVGGTNAFPTSITTTTCTPTGASFTIVNTPVGGSTDIFQLSASKP